MEARKRELEAYLSPTGKDLYREWLGSIRDQSAVDRIRVRIRRVIQGNFGDCRPVGGGVHELRIDTGAGYRVYFGEDGDKVILLGGSAKSGQEAGIKAAKIRWEEYNA